MLRLEDDRRTSPGRSLGRIALVALCGLAFSGPATAQVFAKYVDLYRCRTEPPVMMVSLDPQGTWQRTPIATTGYYTLTQVFTVGGYPRYEVRSYFNKLDECPNDWSTDGIFECWDFMIDLNALRFTRVDARRQGLDPLPGTIFLEMGYCEPIPAYIPPGFDAPLGW